MNKSSHIDRAEYDDGERKLTLTFKGNRVYEYPDVPRDYYDGLEKAHSPGSFFHRHIMPRFTGRLVHKDGD